MGRGGRGPLPCGDGQDRSSATDLVPRQGLTPSDLLEDGSVMAADLERGRFPTTHGATSLAGTTLGYQQRGCPEFRALLRARHTRSHAATDHWLSERVFDWSGVPTVHIRPTYFAEWLLYLAPMIRAGRLHVPFGTGKHAPIAAEDQGRVIAGLLEDPAAHAGKIYPLFGPVEYTYEETAQLLSRVLGKDVQYKQVDFEEFSNWQQASGKNAGRDNSFLFQHLREVAIDHQNGIFAGTNDLVEKLSGRPPMTLEAFIEKHKPAFV